MATRRLAWVLNLDADLELAGGAGYTPKQTVRAAMKLHVKDLATSLLAPGDLLIDEGSPEGVARGAVGRAFCPTPRALAVLKRAGAEPEPHPPLDVLRRVNSRAFASALGMTLPGAAFVTDTAVARQMLAAPPTLGPAWRVKHAFGMTGRNQRVIDPREAADGDRELAFLAGWIAAGGGVQIEPNVRIVTEYGLHARLAEDGSLVRGEIVVQQCDARGAWIASERIVHTDDARRALAARLEEEVSNVARALFAAGYFGPFGVDAYTYEGADGAIAFQPRSEINARYSMGFRTGFGPDARESAP